MSCHELWQVGNKLPMGISIGCQGLSRVIDELFADLKGKFVFNFLHDLVVYSRSREEHGCFVFSKVTLSD
jgi:hypothetical protein